MKFSFVVGQRTHPGRVRPSNEDNLCVLLPTQLVKDFDALVVVADGVGGNRAGEVASQYVADTLRDLFSSTKYQTFVGFSPEREDYPILVVKEVIERLNDDVYQMANRREDWRGMGTTITLALMVDDRVFIGHVGDSSAYLFSKGTLRKLTKDHSWVMEQVEQGAMTPEQANADPRKKIITRAVGSSNLIKVDRIVESLQPEDVLLLCSDGLSNMVNDTEMVHVLQAIPEPQAACESLVELANQHGGSDNITVVIARAYAVGDQQPLAGLPARQKQAMPFGLHDTQPLGPVEQFRKRERKSAEPVRISPSQPPIQPETSVVVETKPDEVQSTPEPEKSPITAPLDSSQVANQPTVQGGESTDSLNAVPPSAPSPGRSKAPPTALSMLSMTIYALFAAIVNGGLVFAYFLLPPELQVPNYLLAVLVAGFTLFLTILGFIVLVLNTGFDFKG